MFETDNTDVRITRLKTRVRSRFTLFPAHRWDYSSVESR